MLASFGLRHSARVIRLSVRNMSQKSLEGKVAIVTGSTDGIGYAVAERLGKDGAQVVVSSRKEKNVAKAVEQLQAKNIKAFGVPCHVGKTEDRKRLVNETINKFGCVDILVSTAGANPAFGDILDVDEDSWDKIMDINVKSSFFMCKEVIPHMQKKGSGSIVLMSSIAAFSPLEGIAAYGVSKTALLGLTKALAVRCASSNIRVNSVAPGMVKTSFSQAFWTNPDLEKKVSKGIPLNRFAVPSEIANCVVFLASDEASYVTGETLVIAGGMQSRL